MKKRFGTYSGAEPDVCAYSGEPVQGRHSIVIALSDGLHYVTVLSKHYDKVTPEWVSKIEDELFPKPIVEEPILEEVITGEPIVEETILPTEGDVPVIPLPVIDDSVIVESIDGSLPVVNEKPKKEGK